MSFVGLDIATALTDPALLGPHFPSPSWDRWRSVLKAIFGEPLTPRERELLRPVTGDREPPRKRVSEANLIKGRGGGGTAAASAIATYCAITFNGHARLRPGERGVVAFIAFDRAQARQIARFTRGLFEETPALATMVESATDDTIELNNRVTIQIFSNNFRSIRGRSLVAAIFDECAFWRDEAYANPDIEVHAAATPGLGRVEGSLLAVVTSPYKRSGLAYDMHVQSFGIDDPHRLAVLGSTSDFNPTFDPAVIERDLARDYARFSAEYLCRWRDDVGTFLSWDLIERAAVINAAGLEPMRGVAYVCGLDASGGRRDAMTLAIAHRTSDGRVVVDLVYGRKAPFEPAEVVKEFASMMLCWGVSEATADAYAGEWVASGFAANGIRILTTTTAKSAIYLEVEPTFAQGTIDIPKHVTLLTELRELERRTHRSGRDSVDHPSSENFHDDYANAMAIAAWTAATAEGTSLWHRRDLLAADQPAPWPRRVDLVFASIMADDHGVAVCYWACLTRFGAPTLTLIDFTVAPFTPSVFVGIRDRLHAEARSGHARAAAYTTASLAAQIHLQFDDAALVLLDQGNRAAAIAAELPAEGVADALLRDRDALLLAAAGVIGGGAVKIAQSAHDHSQTSPLPLLNLRMGAPPSAATDAALLGIGVIIDSRVVAA